MICCTKIYIFNGMVTLLPARSFIQYDLIRKCTDYSISVNWFVNGGRQKAFTSFVQEHISENYLSSTDFNEDVIRKGPDLPWKYCRSVATFLGFILLSAR